MMRRIAALALAGLLAALAYAALVRPALEAHRRYDQRIAELTGRLAQVRRWTSEGEAMRALLAERRGADASRQRYLSETNAALASAELQDIVKRAVALGQGELISTQVMNAQRLDGAPEITVRARARGGVRSLQRMLHALEGGSPMLFVGNLSVDSASGDLVLGFEATGYMRQPRRLTAVALEAPLPALAKAAPLAPALQQYEEIVARSLFAPTRRPAAELVPAPEREPSSAARALSLVGVLILKKKQLAIMREAGSERDIRLAPGEAWGEWTLAQVHTDGVLLRSGERSLELSIPRLKLQAMP